MSKYRYHIKNLKQNATGILIQKNPKFMAPCRRGKGRISLPIYYV